MCRYINACAVWFIFANHSFCWIWSNCWEQFCMYMNTTGTNDTSVTWFLIDVMRPSLSCTSCLLTVCSRCRITYCYRPMQLASRRVKILEGWAFFLELRSSFDRMSFLPAAVTHVVPVHHLRYDKHLLRNWKIDVLWLSCLRTCS